MGHQQFYKTLNVENTYVNHQILNFKHMKKLGIYGIVNMSENMPSNLI